ncbi:MAG: hypothetical protein PVS3B3_21650 [Ktedonobacteraceae bacterium]
MSQKELAAHRHRLGRNPVLQHHPVLTPVVLLCSSLLLGVASFFADTIFSVLKLVGVPVGTLVLLCVLVAFVLGIVGVLASIIGILEQVDRYCSTTGVSILTFLRLKEQTYANRN